MTIGPLVLSKEWGNEVQAKKLSAESLVPKLLVLDRRPGHTVIYEMMYP